MNEKIYHNGKEASQSNTKTVLKSVNKMEQHVGMPQAKKEENQNKNHPTAQREKKQDINSKCCRC